MATSYQKTLTKLKRRQGLLRIFLFSLVTVVVWIVASIIFSQKRTQIPRKLQDYAQPLNPNIDRSVFDEIEQRRKFTQDELRDFPIYALEVSKDGEQRLVPIEELGKTPPPQAVPGPVATQSAGENPLPSPAASPPPSSPAMSGQ